MSTTRKCASSPHSPNHYQGAARFLTMANNVSPRNEPPQLCTGTSALLVLARTNQGSTPAPPHSNNPLASTPAISASTATSQTQSQQPPTKIKSSSNAYGDPSTTAHGICRNNDHETSTSLGRGATFGSRSSSREDAPNYGTAQSGTSTERRERKVDDEKEEELFASILIKEGIGRDVIFISPKEVEDLADKHFSMDIVRNVRFRAFIWDCREYMWFILVSPLPSFFLAYLVLSACHAQINKGNRHIRLN